MKTRKNTYLSEFFLTKLGRNFDLHNITRVLTLTEKEILKRSEISNQELKDLWDVLKDFTSILVDNYESLSIPALYGKISIFLLSPNNIVNELQS